MLSDVRRKKLLSLCRLYLEKSIKTFEDIDAPMEYLSVQNDRIDLQDFLFETRGQNNVQKGRHLQTAIGIVCNSVSELAKIDKMLQDSPAAATVLKQFESKLQLILRKSIKFAMSKSPAPADIATLKELYAMTLRAPKESDIVDFAQYLKNILERLQTVNIE